MSKSKGHQIKSLARALGILEILAKANREMSLIEISNNIGLAKSTSGTDWGLRI